MARWLTFDRNTASALRKQLPREQVFEHGASSAVEYARGTQQDLITLLPTGSTGKVAIAVFRQMKPVLVANPAVPDPQPSPKPAPLAWKVVSPEIPATAAPKIEAAASAEPKPARNRENELPFVRQKAPEIRAGGILGTRDEVVFDEETAVKPKRNWWQKFWDEDE